MSSNPATDGPGLWTKLARGMGAVRRGTEETTVANGARLSLATAFSLSALLGCGARSTLEIFEAAGGAPASTASSSAASTGTTSASGTGGGGPVACEPPFQPWSLATPLSGVVRDSVSVTDPEGNLFLLAAYSGDPDLGAQTRSDPGQEGMLLMRLDRCGDVAWIQPMPGTLPVVAKSGAWLGDRLVFAGELGGEIDFGNGPRSGQGGSGAFVVAFSPDGEALWTRTFNDLDPGAPDFSLGAVAASDEADALFVTGGFAGTVDLGDGPRTAVGGSDVFIVQLDPADGNTLLVQTYGSPRDEDGTSLAVTARGRLCLAALRGPPLDPPDPFNPPNVPWVPSPDPPVLESFPFHWGPDLGATELSVLTFGDDCLAVGGYQGALPFGPITLPTAADGWNGFAASWGPDGKVKWARPFGPGFGVLRSAVAAPGLGLLIGGTLLGGWSFEEGTDLGDAGVEFDRAFVLSLDAETGAFGRGSTFEGASHHGVRNLHPDRSGGLRLTGFVEGPGLDFGQGPLAQTGPQGVFAARIDWPPSDPD